MDSGRFTDRRTLLRALGSISAIPLAGCNTNRDTSSETDTPTDTPSPDTHTSSTESRTQTRTSSDDQPPTVERVDVTPEQAGTVLDVSMVVRDDRGLASAEISYGDQTTTIQLEGSDATIEERLTDISASDAHEVRYHLRDAAGNDTAGSISPDSTAPSLRVEPRTPSSAGVIQLAIEGEDDVGLSELRVWLNDHQVLRESVTGRKTVSRDTSVSTEAASTAAVGERNRVSIELTDTIGNDTRAEVEQYVRKYDKMEDTRLDLGGIYISQAGDALTNNLSDDVDTEPAVGIYDSPIPTEITSRHFDQMTGFGIDRVVYDFAGVKIDGDRVENFMASDLIDQVEVSPFYIVPRFIRNMDRSWKTDILPPDLSFIREQFLSRDNAVTFDGRPVMSTWNFRYLAADDDLRNKLMDEFGSFASFVQFIRDGLRTNRGEAFLVCGVGGDGPILEKEGFEARGRLAEQFDAITNWFHGTRGGWDAVIERATESFKACHEFATERDMEFIPVVRPGYDERWDTGDYRTTNRYLPRDPDRLRQLLDLADEYRTTDRINIPYNDWIEGHTIEPGTFTGTDYGTDYLEVVKRFQQRDR